MRGECHRRATLQDTGRLHKLWNFPARINAGAGVAACRRRRIEAVFGNWLRRGSECLPQHIVTPHVPRPVGCPQRGACRFKGI